MGQGVSNNRGLLELFSEIAADEISGVAVENLKIQKVNFYKKSGKLEILASSAKLIRAEAITLIEEKVKKLFHSDSVQIKIKFELSLTLGDILSQYQDSLIHLLNRNIAMSRGILTGAVFEASGSRLTVHLKTGGAAALHSAGCHTLLEACLLDSFAIRAKASFEDPTLDESAMNGYFDHKEKTEAKLHRDDFQGAFDGSNSAGKGSAKPAQKKKSITGEVILGKNFENGLMNISEVTMESGRVRICGCIFSVEFREIRGGRFLCTFDITDYTSSVTVKFFIEKDNVEGFMERIKEKITVKVNGEAQYDKFSKELSIMAADIVAVEAEKRMDDAEEKRVELHLHTQMSSMDAVSHVRDLVARAAEWGHPAVAITDHGVVQAFPDAFEAAKKHKIKVIYGVECYLLADSVPIVYHPTDHSLEDVFVVLDIETTGLNPVEDRITEIGAVKIQNGEILEEYQTLVNPGVPIPPFITKLTGISDQMVQDKPPIGDVLPVFLKFIGHLPVVAHNASFDMGFIRHQANKAGYSITNPVVDTLQLSRKLLPGLAKHKLNLVAQHLDIRMQNHHRAVDDAQTAAQIFTRFVDMMKSRGIYCLDDVERELVSDNGFTRQDSYHAILLAENQTGLKNLYKIISQSHLKYFHKKPRVPRHLLNENREGIMVGSACEAGEIFSAILNGKEDKDISRIADFYDYYEIQPLGNNQFLLNQGKVSSQEELKNINRRIVKLGEEKRKPVVATCDVHFMDPRDEAFRRILMSGQGYSDADNQAPLFFRTTDEMLAEFEYLGEKKAHEVVIKNPNRIAQAIENIIPIPEGTFPPRIEGAEEEIKQIAEKRTKELYGEKLPAIVQERLDKELHSIITNGFSVMYIIAQKLVAKSLSDGYLVGSRGSVGSSFVANMVGITEVNSLPPHYICRSCKHSEFITDGSFGCGFDLPDKTCPKCGTSLVKDGYDIPFETFLGFEGDKEPDIDLNFSGAYQSVAHKYTEELFGTGNVFRAGTIATIADKTAYGFVKNYLDERAMVVTNAEINRLVKGCTGIKRTTGQHPGGVMIVPADREIYEFCPIQRPADDTKSEIITTHFDYHSISGRLLKLDILGHDDPTVIRMLEDLTGVDARSIPIGEPKTMGLFSSTESLKVKPNDIDSEVGTFAVPEFGTKFVRQMLLDTKPTTFSELIKISGLSHGTDVWLNNAQELIRSQKATLADAICCRDDIMIYLIHAGLPSKTAFKIMEDVRKGKGIKPEYEECMRENKVPEWYIESCKKIKYMFPKAHAAAYVMMAFRIAWFKVHYPEAFYVAYFTVRADEFDAELMTHGKDRVHNKIKEMEKKSMNLTQKEKNVLTILEVAHEMYARGIQFLPVDLYTSDAERFQIITGGIRPPLNALQGLGGAAAQNIVEARKNGEFLSIDDLKIRAKVSKSVIEILQQQGCLNGMAESNQLSLF